MSYALAFWPTLKDEQVLGWAQVAGTEVGRRNGVMNPGMSWTRGTSSTLDCAKDLRGLERAL